MKYVKKETKRQQKIREKKPSCMSSVGNKKGIKKKSRRKWQWNPPKIEEIRSFLSSDES